MDEAVKHPDVIWRKGSRSMANGTCVEVAKISPVSAGDDSTDSMEKHYN